MVKLLFVKLPKKEHIENVAGKTSANLSLARVARKRTFPEQAGSKGATTGLVGELLHETDGKSFWTTTHQDIGDFSGCLPPGYSGLERAAGKDAGKGELEGGAKAALTFAQQQRRKGGPTGRSGTPASEEGVGRSSYELGVGRSGILAGLLLKARGGRATAAVGGGRGDGKATDGGSNDVSLSSSSVVKKDPQVEGVAAGDTRTDMMKKAAVESTFSRTISQQVAPRKKRPPRKMSWWPGSQAEEEAAAGPGEEDKEEDVEEDDGAGLARAVRVGENMKAMARISRRQAKKFLEEQHQNKKQPFDEQAALSARREEQESFWRQVLKKNGHWVLGTESEVTTTVARSEAKSSVVSSVAARSQRSAPEASSSAVSTAASSTSAAGKAIGIRGKEFNYGKLTLPGDTQPKKKVPGRSTYPWDEEEALLDQARLALMSPARLRRLPQD